MQDSTNRLRQLFDALRIKWVIWVDDDFYIAHHHVEAIVETLVELAPENRVQCGIVLGVEIDEMEDWKLQLPDVWGSLGPSDQANKLEQLKALDSNAFESYFGHNFPNHVSELCSWLPVTKYAPSQWNAASETIKEHVNGDSDGAVLVFVDQDLHKDPQAPSKDGLTLINRAFNDGTTQRVFYGLLSQTFDINDELTTGKRLALENKVPLTRFVPISKKRLDSAPKFTEGMRLTFLMLACAQMANEVAATTATAARNARERLDYMDVHDFYEVVVATSDREGIWEVETLLRLFDVYHSNYMREGIQEKKQTMDGWTGHIRDLIKDIPRTDNTATHAWIHNRVEYYDAPEILNRFHFPLELGDVFRVDGTDYILLGQPCDLSIRTSGQRSAKFVTIVELSANKPNKNQVMPELRFFSNDGKSRYANFKQMQPITLDILDLAVFDPQGICQFTLDQACPSELHGPWKQRFEYLTQHYRDWARRLDELNTALQGFTDTGVRDRVWQAALSAGALTGFLEGKCTYDQGGFAYPIQRIGRYRQPRVGALLQQWASFMSRPAFDPEFGA